MSRPLYVYRLDVEIPPELRWPNEPPNWMEVFKRFGWDDEFRVAGRGPDDDDGFRWPYLNRRHWFTEAAAERRAEVLRALGATVTITRSQPVEWPA